MISPEVVKVGDKCAGPQITANSRFGAR